MVFRGQPSSRWGNTGGTRSSEQEVVAPVESAKQFFCSDYFDIEFIECFFMMNWKTSGGIYYQNSTEALYK